MIFAVGIIFIIAVLVAVVAISQCSYLAYRSFSKLLAFVAVGCVVASVFIHGTKTTLSPVHSVVYAHPNYVITTSTGQTVKTRRVDNSADGEYAVKTHTVTGAYGLYKHTTYTLLVPVKPLIIKASDSIARVSSNNLN